MALTEQQVGGVRHRLFSIGIPSSLSLPFTVEISKWVQHSGIEWTIKRLKDLKVDLFRRRANLAPISWIRKNSRNDVGGVVGALYRYSDKGPKQFFRAVQSFQAYTYFTFDTLSESQKLKFLNAINAPEVEIPLDIISIVRKSAKNVVGMQKIDRNDPVRGR